MGVKQGPEPDFVTWSDVIEHLRYYEQGYGVHINVSCFQKCPPGEQFAKLYWKARVCDELGNEVGNVPAGTASFPTKRWRTVPALLLHLLWELDSRMSAALTWSEPLAEKPRRGNGGPE